MTSVQRQYRTRLPCHMTSVQWLSRRQLFVLHNFIAQLWTRCWMICDFYFELKAVEIGMWFWWSWKALIEKEIVVSIVIFIEERQRKNGYSWVGHYSDERLSVKFVDTASLKTNTDLDLLPNHQEWHSRQTGDTLPRGWHFEIPMRQRCIYEDRQGWCDLFLTRSSWVASCAAGIEEKQ